MLLGDLIHRGGALWPSRTAFIWGGRHRTYGELERRVQRLSAVFTVARSWSRSPVTRACSGSPTG